MEQSRAAAKEGLALLPVVSAGTPLPRTRKLLELEAEAKHAARWPQIATGPKQNISPWKRHRFRLA